MATCNFRELGKSLAVTKLRLRQVAMHCEVHPRFLGRIQGVFASLVKFPAALSIRENK
jgi:hypothetical protein